MGFFEKDNGARASNTSSSISDQLNMVGAGTVFEGTLSAGSDVRVSGTLIGKLDVNGRVLIAPDGSVEGDIKAANADIAGTVQGKIEVTERLVLKGSARIEGEIYTQHLVVEEGAHFSGACHMDGVPDNAEPPEENLISRQSDDSSLSRQTPAEPELGNDTDGAEQVDEELPQT